MENNLKTELLNVTNSLNEANATIDTLKMSYVTTLKILNEKKQSEIDVAVKTARIQAISKFKGSKEFTELDFEYVERGIKTTG